MKNLLCIHWGGGGGKMALNYLMRDKKEDNICDSSLQEMALFCGIFQEGIYLCPMFHFGLQREKNKQIFKHR